MIKHYSLKALQKAINHALSLDESTTSKLQNLEGKLLEIVIMPLDAHFFIQFHQGILQLLANTDLHPDTIIHSSPIGLIRLSLLPASQARSLFNDKVRLSGDVELGQQVKKLFDELDIDWEGHLAQFTGDMVAHQIGSLVRRGMAFKQHFTRSMQQNITEYVQEELRIFPSREEIEDFFQDVDKISLHGERLEMQIKQLMTSYELD